MSAKIHARYEDFAEDFLAPLMAGGICTIGRPLTVGMLDHFSIATPASSDAELAIRDSLSQIGGAVAPARYLPFPERGAMALAMAAHNFVFITDPELDRIFTRGSREKVMTWIAALLAEVKVPKTRGEALARHAVAERFLKITRNDVEVSNWAASFSFLGRPIPRNYTAMPGLRRIKQVTKSRPLAELLEATQRGMKAPPLPRYRELFSRSPVTELIHADTLGGVSFGLANLSVLSDPALRHGIADAVVKRGVAGYAKPFGSALRNLSALGPPPEFLYCALAFIAEIQILEVLDQRRGHTPKSVPAVGDEELFAGVLPALHQHQGALSFMLTLETRDLEKVKERARQLFHLAGEDAVRFALTILERAQPPSAAQETHP